MKKILLAFVMLAMAVGSRAGEGDVKQAMRRATQYMMDVVAYNGGFVWNYLPDFSRQWGELEAKRTMVWLQSPGTPDMGQVMLDAYHATGDEYYYDCARCIALCIVQGQLPCGGWNYMFDLEPEDSLKYWYDTIGKQAWRLEEFQHYYGNATFDDEATKHCAEFLLRFYLEKRDSEFRKPLDKAISFFVDSQYENGGWPQRYPIMTDHPFKGKEDYTPFVTINDNVLIANIDFLLQCYTLLDMSQLRQPIIKAIQLIRDLQLPKPLAGWADQYDAATLTPAHARSYEPRAVNTGTTVGMIRHLLNFYRLTGDKSLIKGIPDAIDFLESLQLPRQLADKVRQTPLTEHEILVPRFIDPDTKLPLYVHRKGSNVANGTYYTDQKAESTIAHYSSFVAVNTRLLREELRKVEALWQKDLERNSPLNVATHQGTLTSYYDRYLGYMRGVQQPTPDEVVKALDEKGRWISTLRQVSNPYKPIPKTLKGDSEDTSYAQTMVGDEYDTSPYENQETKGISTRTFIHNMATLIRSLKPEAKTTISGLNPERFKATVEGKPTSLYVLRNGDLEACITNYGARVVSLMVPDKDGKLDDVVQGFDNIDDYHLYKNNFGSVVGRYVGRIKGAHFTLDGQPVFLQKSGGGNISHGGYPGFADHVWDVVAVSDTTLQLRLVSPDGDNGFPGTLTVDATYTLSHDHALTISYKATTDKPTVVNLSNHSFFNLAGDTCNTVLQQLLFVDGKYITTYDKQKNVDGNFMKVRNTPFDFTSMKPIGTDIEIYDEQMSITKGYDHAYALRHPGSSVKPAAILCDEASGREMKVYTTEPAVQVYTANGLNGSLIGKKGVKYERQSAICLETMHFADSPNQPEFPTTILRPGETYNSSTTYQFGLQSHKKRNLQKNILMYVAAASVTSLGVVGVMSVFR